MKKALTEELLEEVLSKKESFSLEVVYDINELFTYLEDLGWGKYEGYVEYDANGYQVDWWKTYIHEEHGKLELAGSFWYMTLEGAFLSK